MNNLPACLEWSEESGIGEEIVDGGQLSREQFYLDGKDMIPKCVDGCSSLESQHGILVEWEG
jgi:hypothetical protein